MDLVQEVIDRINPTAGFEIFSVTDEAEYFPLPRQLRSFLNALQAAVEGGLTARNPGRPGLLENDRDWTATEALQLVRP